MSVSAAATASHVTLFSDSVRQRLHQPSVLGGQQNADAGAPFGQLLPRVGDGEDAFCWAANGPCLEVLCARTGLRRAFWTFGLHLPNQMVQITCVRRLSAEHVGDRPDAAACSSLLLAVGLDCAQAGGLVCVFDARLGVVVRAISVAQPVTCLALCPLPPLLPSTLAVGTQDGHVLLASLSLETGQWRASDERSPGRLVFNDMTTMTGGDVTANFTSNWDVSCAGTHVLRRLTEGQHWAMRVNPAAVAGDEFVYGGGLSATTDSVRLPLRHAWVSCVEYVRHINSLVIGFSFGCFQIWSVEHMRLEFSSRYEPGLSPMIGCVYLEPENDPRHFVYLWTLLSVPAFHDVNGSVAVAALFSLLYTDSRQEEQQQRDSSPSVYGENLAGCGGRRRRDRLVQAEVRLIYELTTSPHRPRPDLVSASCLLTCVALPATSTTACAGGVSSPDRSLLSCPSTEPQLTASTRCALVWEAWSLDRASHTFLALFDLNDWYAAHLPSSIDRARRPFMHFVPLHVSSGIAMDAAVTSLGHMAADGEDGAACVEPLHVTVLLDVGVQRLSFASPLARLMRQIVDAPTLLLQENEVEALYQFAVAERVTALPELDETREFPRREALLSLALRCARGDVLAACAAGWSSDGAEAGPTRSPLRWLLDWAWRQAVHTTDIIDSVCMRLFDASGECLSPCGDLRQTMHEAVTALNTLTSLLADMLHRADCSAAGQTELESRRYVLHLRQLHVSVLVWLHATGLLPEEADGGDGRVDPGVFAFPQRQLSDWYDERRRAIGSDLLMVEGLVDEMGAAVRAMWREEQGSAFYPPHSLQKATRIYLLDSIPDHAKHRLMHYLLLDLTTECATHEAAFKTFPSAFGVSPADIKLTHGFWHLDHGQPEAALVFLLDPLVHNEDLADWQVRRAVESLLAQQAPRAALQLVRVRMARCSTPGDAWLRARVLLDNGLLSQAVVCERRYRCLGGDAVLRCLLEALERRAQLTEMTQLVMDEFQEKGLVQYLLSSSRVACHELLHAFYIQRGRYSEAYSLHEKVPRMSAFCSTVKSMLPSLVPLDINKSNLSKPLVPRRETSQKDVPDVPLSAKLIRAKTRLKTRSAVIASELERQSVCSSPVREPVTPFRPPGKRRRQPSGAPVDADSGSANFQLDKTPSVLLDCSARKLRPALKKLLQTPPVGRSRSVLPKRSGMSLVLEEVSKRRASLNVVRAELTLSRERSNVMSQNDPKRGRYDPSVSTPETNPPGIGHEDASTNLPTIFTPGRTPKRSHLINESVTTESAHVEQRSADDSNQSISDQSVVSSFSGAGFSARVLPTIFTPGKTPYKLRSSSCVRPRLYGAQSTQSNVSSLMENTANILPPDEIVSSDLMEKVTDESRAAEIPTIFTPGKTFETSGLHSNKVESSHFEHSHVKHTHDSDRSKEDRGQSSVIPTIFTPSKHSKDNEYDHEVSSGLSRGLSESDSGQSGSFGEPPNKDEAGPSLPTIFTPGKKIKTGSRYAISSCDLARGPLKRGLKTVGAANDRTGKEDTPSSSSKESTGEEIFESDFTHRQKSPSFDRKETYPKDTTLKVDATGKYSEEPKSTEETDIVDKGDTTTGSRILVCTPRKAIRSCRTPRQTDKENTNEGGLTGTATAGACRADSSSTVQESKLEFDSQANCGIGSFRTRSVDVSFKSTVSVVGDVEDAATPNEPNIAACPSDTYVSPVIADDAAPSSMLAGEQSTKPAVAENVSGSQVIDNTGEGLSDDVGESSDEQPRGISKSIEEPAQVDISQVESEESVFHSIDSSCTEECGTTRANSSEDKVMDAPENDGTGEQNVCLHLESSNDSSPLDEGSPVALRPIHESSLQLEGAIDGPTEALLDTSLVHELTPVRSRRSIMLNTSRLSPLMEEDQAVSSLTETADVMQSVPDEAAQRPQDIASPSPTHQDSSVFKTPVPAQTAEPEALSHPEDVSSEALSTSVGAASTRRHAKPKRCMSEEPLERLPLDRGRKKRSFSEEPDCLSPFGTHLRRSTRLQRLREESGESACSSEASPSKVRQRRPSHSEMAPNTPTKLSRIKRVSIDTAGDLASPSPCASPATPRRSVRLRRMSEEPEECASLAATPSSASKRATKSGRVCDQFKAKSQKEVASPLTVLENPSTPRRSSRISALTEEQVASPAVATPSKANLEKLDDVETDATRRASVSPATESKTKKKTSRVGSSRRGKSNAEVAETHTSPVDVPSEQTAVEQVGSKSKSAKSKAQKDASTAAQATSTLKTVESSAQQDPSTTGKMLTPSTVTASKTGSSVRSRTARRTSSSSLSSAGPAVLRSRRKSQMRFQPSDQYVSPIRLGGEDPAASTVATRMVARAVAGTVESPAARVRRSSLKKARRRTTSVTRDFVRLW